MPAPGGVRSAEIRPRLAAMETVVTMGPHTFDSTLQTANAWLREIDDRLQCEDRQTAYEAWRVVPGPSARTPVRIRGLLIPMKGA